MRRVHLDTLLCSDAQLVVCEAPAGCGKTYQGARLGAIVAGELSRGRVLVLTHTNAAANEFRARLRVQRSRCLVRTLDSLVVDIATAYRIPLGLPGDVSQWAIERSGGDDSGFVDLAKHVADFLESAPIVSSALVERFPFVIADEHQDAMSCEELSDLITIVWLLQS